MSQYTVLVVEDDLALQEAICDTLSLAGYSCRAAPHGKEAIQQLSQQRVDMVVTDVNMPEMNGHDLLLYIKQHYPQIPVLLATAYGSINQAVQAMKMGAIDYLVKPFAPEALLDIVGRVITGCSNIKEADSPVAVAETSRQLLALAKRVAASDSTVLISGESGSGKEVLARYIHQQSARVKQPFIAINCAAIPENMLEATLFGHEKGAFTGAYQSMPGKFEQAEGGTLLLDEISEMALGLQAKLLRVLQEREVERVGGRKTISLDVRVLATTNRDMLEQVKAGSFREDLYYRLCVFPLQLLPLRERPADIVPIAERLFSQHCQKMQRVPVHLDASAKQQLLHYHWPGNVRELDNAIQRALILQPGDIIYASDLCVDLSPEQLMSDIQVNSPVFHTTVPVATMVDSPPSEMSLSECSHQAQLCDGVRQREFQLIIDALRQEQGKRKEAAVKLGISPRTLRYKLAKMREAGINVEAAIGG
ncbi:sigma-54-dependent Fis family transcriptional regulator [Endozoicomonas sp. SM1973]|uniref:Sigma-54-dependent Fis family transcriptional regulator n=1 Tax=Spartinivicinus marinus TaxID=2994442 RepID=A0A853HWW7_9GAMM|nr:sigma-54 dependent transcriptional regulator [Spartinivicinus marinus]MCX4029878.1 sigma-54 dependent transcriptional regulator [Spartinivicinus marinus]NYZ64879.1 sigma-54-dependent Fis family transcriptional regulator [Spartinivicinus marinus]